MLAALAIVGFVALALFQSAGRWMALSSRAADVAEGSLGAAADQLMFEQLVQGLVAAWPAKPDEGFQGSATGFSGLTRAPLHKIEPGIYAFAMALGEDQDGARVVYAAGQGVSWTLARLDGEDARFAYLGADLLWRDRWPPAQTPEPGPFNDSLFYSVDQLPLAIRLDATGRKGRIAWIAATGGEPAPPVRIDDVGGEASIAIP